MDEDSRDRGHKWVGWLMIGLILAGLAYAGYFAWDRFRPAGENPARPTSEGVTQAKRPAQAAATTADIQGQTALKCNPFALHPTKGHPVYTAPVGGEFPVVLSCLEMQAGEPITVTITGPTTRVTETLPLEDLDGTWVFVVHLTTLTEAGIHTVEFRYKGQLITRYHIEAMN